MKGKSICIIQKEYPTAHDLNKSKRQHWDIAVIQSPPKVLPYSHPSYDYLFLHSAIEFALNTTKKHLIEDIRRLSHPKSNVKNKYIIHLYRISDPKFSKRDLSPRSNQILKPEEILNIVGKRDVEIYFGLINSTERPESGLWQINYKGIKKVE